MCNVSGRDGAQDGEKFSKRYHGSHEHLGSFLPQHQHAQRYTRHWHIRPALKQGG
jgi:hypothetical protein